jgi:hypothetical protein
MTLDELTAALAPIADAALHDHNDVNVIKIGIVLACIVTAIDGRNEPDEVVLDELADHAGLICEQRQTVNQSAGERLN